MLKYFGTAEDVSRRTRVSGKAVFGLFPDFEIKRVFRQNIGTDSPLNSHSPFQVNVTA